MVRSWYCGWYSVVQSVTAACFHVSRGTVDCTQLLLWPVLSYAVSYCCLFSMCPVVPWMVRSWYCGRYSVVQSVTAACSACVLWYCGRYAAGTVDGTQLCSQLLQPVLHVSCCTVDGA